MPVKAQTKRIEAVYPAIPESPKRSFCYPAEDGWDCFGDSGEFRADTALYTAALAMAAADKEMLREDLEAMGYEDVSMISFDDCSETGIGTAIGIKPASDGAVIAVILRPTTGREWYSNFDVGYGAEHSGFLKAAEFAEQRLGDRLFIRRHKTENPRFLVTGYSRGGAVANLLAKRLCDRWGLDRVRCYTFASPNTTVNPRAARYHTVFNLTRDEDFFSRIPLTGWGYTKYGRTVSLSGTGDFEKEFRALSGEDYIGFSSPKPVDALLGALIQLAPNVRAYYERRYPVGETELSLREYMAAVAATLADDADEHTADTLMNATVSEFAGLSDFLMSGMDIGALLAPVQGIPRCSVADSHSPAAYMTALEAFLR